MWQMAGVGPMFGQLGYFKLYATEQLTHAIDRYTREVTRLCRVLDSQLIERAYVAGEYSIADMAIYPWLARMERFDMDLSPFPGVQGWRTRMAQRPAVVRAMAVGRELGTGPVLTDESRAVLFGQAATKPAASGG
jgi:GST-like protein